MRPYVHVPRRSRRGGAGGRRMMIIMMMSGAESKSWSKLKRLVFFKMNTARPGLSLRCFSLLMLSTLGVFAGAPPPPLFPSVVSDVAGRAASVHFSADVYFGVHGLPPTFSRRQVVFTLTTVGILRI
jgi:hypothetical protein